VGVPPGCQWITYLRSHDDIGWGFADEDAYALGIDPHGHRDFLNAFYSGSHEASFARGELFQVNERTGDARVSGTLASLAGLEAAIESSDPVAIDLAVDRIVALQTVAFTVVGIPMLYLGDEIGTCNDHRFADEPEHAHDNRWMHRPVYDWAALARSQHDPTSPGGRILAGIRSLAGLRRSHPALGGGVPHIVESGHRSVISYTRSGGGRQLLVAVNLGDDPATVSIDGRGASWSDLTRGGPATLTGTLPPYGVLLAEAPAHQSSEGISPGQVG
jgi:amylosucrase